MTTEKESLEQRIAELSALYGDGKDVVNDSSKDELIARLEAEHQNFQGVFNVEKGIFFTSILFSIHSFASILIF